MNNGVVRDRDNNFSRHQTFKDGVTIEGGLTVDITGGSNAEETADFTAEAGKVYIVDTSSAAITATLPASPAALEEVTFMDGAKTFNTNALTVNTNGKKLDGATVSTKVHTTKGGAFKYIYRNATYGWLLKAFVFMLFALNIHAGDFTYEMNSWEQDSGLSIGTDKLKSRTAGELLSIADSAGTTVATITTSAMAITTASIGTLDVSTSQIGTLSLTNALPVASGGTGLSELAAGRIPYGAGTGAFSSNLNLTFNGTSVFRIPGSSGVSASKLELFSSGFWAWGIFGDGNFLRFKHDATERITLSAISGNLGIGATAPAKKLEVLDTAGAQARLTHSSGNYTDFQTDGDGNLSFSPTGDDDLTGVRFKRRQRIVTSSVGNGSTATATFSQLFDIAGSEGGKILIFVRRSSSVRHDAGMRTYAFYRFTEGGANNQASVASLHSALVHPGGGAGGTITDITATIGGTNVRDLIVTITTSTLSTYEVSVIVEGDRGNDRY